MCKDLQPETKIHIRFSATILILWDIYITPWIQRQLASSDNCTVGCQIIFG